MTSKTEIYLNSSSATIKRNGTYNSDLLYLFNTPIVPPSGYNLTVRLKSLYVPISWTLVNTDNNTLTLNSVDYTIPEGNYSATQLATAIHTLLENSEPSFTITFDSITNKYTFTDSDDFTLGGSCDYLLGLDGTSSSVNNSLVSTYPCDLTGNNQIFLSINNLSTSNISSTTGGSTSIIGSVLVDVPYGSVLYYFNVPDNYFVSYEDALTFAHVSLLGENGVSLLNLNNIDWSCTLEIGFELKTAPVSVPSFKDIYVDYLRSLDVKKKIKNICRNIKTYEHCNNEQPELFVETHQY